MPDRAAQLSELFVAFAAGDLDAVRAALTDDVVWVTPGESVLAGHYVGPDAVVAQLSRSGRLTGGTYTATVVDLLAGDNRVAVLYDGSETRGGVTATLRILTLYEFTGERISAVRALPLDQTAFDAFWAA